jgi:mannose-6-phosphate isomerase-like protein (cupin superfamily)
METERPLMIDPTSTYAFLDGGPDLRLVPLTDDFWATIRGRADLQGGHLVTSFEQTGDWSSWECHPNGDELVLVVSGWNTFHLEIGDQVVSVPVDAGSMLVVPAGVWHTADVNEPGRILAITWGDGTQTRERV